MSRTANYPSFRYHRDGSYRLIRDAEEAGTLGPGWHSWPTAQMSDEEYAEFLEGKPGMKDEQVRPRARVVRCSCCGKQGHSSAVCPEKEGL
jgi:hypothetical protein